ncbi:hypothetical protein TW95_gp0642 [Pandoravirus inopinatum]|uniref:Uncharacterized protein n=1 Tax=Pandoravirus inopinatum TaxID=1605721 RepID=A0A0B5J970_9VIRU|nr:hypothetical protein TW95_gp0642 [Pandoravirus inopinatum]AJF97376.1 hypothetical protein [Pandoravirus inopinatum]
MDTTEQERERELAKDSGACETATRQPGQLFELSSSKLCAKNDMAVFSDIATLGTDDASGTTPTSPASTAAIRLGACPLRWLAAREIALALKLADCFGPSDVAHMASVSKGTLTTLADVVVRSEGAPVSLDLARSVVAYLPQAKIMADAVTVLINERCGLVDWSRGSGLCLLPMPLATAILEGRHRWPFRALWDIAARAFACGRHDIVAHCRGLQEAICTCMRAYVRAAMNPWSWSQGVALGSWLCKAAGLALPLDPSTGSLAMVLTDAKSMAALQMAHKAGKWGHVQLVDFAIDAARESVRAGIDLVRGGRLVMRILGPEPRDRCAHAAAVAHVLVRVVAGIGLERFQTVDDDHITRFDALFERMTTLTLAVIIPALEEVETPRATPPATPSDPLYRASVATTFGKLCRALLRLLDSAVEAHTMHAARLIGTSCAIKTHAMRAARLIGVIVSAGAQPPQCTRWLECIWPALCRPIFSGGRPDRVALSTAAVQGMAVRMAAAQDRSLCGGLHLRKTIDADLFRDLSTALDPCDPRATLVDCLAHFDPALTARVFFYLDPEDLGALAVCSRLALTLVASMVIPPATGGPQRALIAGLCDGGDVPQRLGIDAPETVVHLTPTAGPTGPDAVETMRLVSLACFCLPAIRSALCRMEVELPYGFVHESSEPPRGLYTGILPALATAIGNAVACGSGAAAGEALALGEHAALLGERIGADIDESTHIVHGNGKGKCADSWDTLAIYDTDEKRSWMVDGRAWHVAAAVARVAGLRCDVRVLRLACAMAAQKMGSALTGLVEVRTVGSRKHITVRRHSADETRVHVMAILLNAVTSRLAFVGADQRDAPTAFVVELCSHLCRDILAAHALARNSARNTAMPAVVAACRTASLRITLFCARAGVPVCPEWTHTVCRLAAVST